MCGGKQDVGRAEQTNQVPSTNQVSKTLEGGKLLILRRNSRREGNASEKAIASVDCRSWTKKQVECEEGEL